MKTKPLAFLASMVLLGALSVGAANATTFNVFGTFENGAALTGNIVLDNGILLSLDLNASGSIPGDNATHWSGTAICQSSSCGPSLPSYGYYTIPGFTVISESYDARTETYHFSIAIGSGSLASLSWDFTLQPSEPLPFGGRILGGFVFDSACSGSGCPPITSMGLTGGTLVATTPIPSTQLLFLTGLGVLGLLGWRSNRKPAGIPA
jgi:hypothetical protein